ncbi:MAG: metallophosphoesterase [Clostridia bacterium]|nr:metallophosphoesterase [Clostridia bacterium]
MKVYAISDLHLSSVDDKPMDVFGAHWENHFARISEDWLSKVSGEDIVLLPGDLSWALQLENALPDIRCVAALPGKKVIIRGNHDYWWSSISRVRDALPENMYAIQNDAISISGITFCGTRGWILPCEGWDQDDERISKREYGRLKMSLDRAVQIADGGEIICMLHYPPLTEANPDTEVSALIESYGIKHVVYGHLHGVALKGAFRGEHNGVFYHQASCDGTDFKLITILND